MERLILSYLILSYKKNEKEKKKKENIFSAQHHDEKLTGNSFSFRFVPSVSFRFRFRSHSIRIQKRINQVRYLLFWKEKRKPLLLVRGLDHQTIESFVFLSFLFLCSFHFFPWIYIYRYVYVIDRFDTPFFLSFRPLLRVFFLGGKGEWRVFVILSGWLVGC